MRATRIDARAHLERQVVGEVHQPVHLDAGPEPDAVLGHHRPGGAAGHVALDLELGQRLLEPLLQRVELAFAGVDALGARGREQLDVPDGAEILLARRAPRLGLLRRPALGRLAVALRVGLLRLRGPALLARAGGSSAGGSSASFAALRVPSAFSPFAASGLALAVRLVGLALQPLQRMPGERGQGERRERQEARPAPRRPRRSLAGSGPAKKPGTTPTIRPRNRSRVEIERTVHVDEHAGEIRQQHAEPDDQERRALHVQRAEPLEAGEREPDAQQRNPERAGAEHAPERLAQRMADRAGDRERQERQADEETGDQGGDRAQPPARVGAHTGTGASVTRRSWKCASTG